MCTQSLSKIGVITFSTIIMHIPMPLSVLSVTSLKRAKNAIPKYDNLPLIS